MLIECKLHSDRVKRGSPSSRLANLNKHADKIARILKKHHCRDIRLDIIAGTQFILTFKTYLHKAPIVFLEINNQGLALCPVLIGRKNRS